jgi:hypothetical protein
MMKGTAFPRTGTLAAGLAALMLLALAGCGGGGGGGDPWDDTEDLFVLRFNVPNFAGIRLDEAVNWVFSEDILAGSLNHDSIQIRTGATGGTAPRGAFVKGIFLIDNVHPDLARRGRRLVVDPGQLTSEEIQEAEQFGRVQVIPESSRYDDPDDDGFTAVAPGQRRILYDRTFGNVAMFVPEVPTRLDYSDSGYQPSSTYTVVLPTFPALNTVKSIGDDPLLPREGRIFTSTFTTVASTAAERFLGGEYWFVSPRGVNSDPATGEVIAQVYRDESGNILYAQTNASLNPGSRFVIEDDRAPFGLLNPPDEPNVGDPGEEPIGVDTSIAIRFSQPLDPLWVSTDNFLLNDISVAGEPQQAVSLFLTQSREGRVEVLMTPLNPRGLELGRRYQAKVSTLVRDLLGNPLDQNPRAAGLQDFVFEFRTSGLPSEPKDILESFNDNSHEDQANTTANWNARFPTQVGAASGALAASFAPFAGNASNGVLQPPIGELTVLPTGTPSSPIVYNYTSINIQLGARVEASGSLGLVMHCQGAVAIAGVIRVDGFSGGTGQTGTGADPNLAPGGVGGVPGSGGWGGGAGAMATIGSLGNFNGLTGFGPGGGVGGGIGGHTGDQESSTSSTAETVWREGGGGGGNGGDGGDADVSGVKPSQSPNNGGTGGLAYGPIVPPIVSVATNGFGGSGGGGGGGEDDGPTSGNGNGAPDAFDEGGGGGGGGGGGLQILAYRTITVTGQVFAQGGPGGSSFNSATNDLGQGAPGGGGSGGSIWLQCLGQMTISANAEIKALGGAGGKGDGNGNEIRTGGAGGDGYIRLQDDNGSIQIPVAENVLPIDSNSSAKFSPEIILQSTGTSTFYDQVISTPNYGAAEVDLSLNNGVILIFVQGAREDVGNPGNPVPPELDPERVFTTDWVPIDGINQVDNYQFLRFRVDFTTNALQLFSEPLPQVREIHIPVSTTPD